MSINLSLIFDSSNRFDCKSGPIFTSEITSSFYLNFCLFSFSFFLFFSFPFFSSYRFSLRLFQVWLIFHGREIPNSCAVHKNFTLYEFWQKSLFLADIYQRECLGAFLLMGGLVGLLDSWIVGRVSLIKNLADSISNDMTYVNAN